jgi:hypothetical protein
MIVLFGCQNGSAGEVATALFHLFRRPAEKKGGFAPLLNEFLDKIHAHITVSTE